MRKLESIPWVILLVPFLAFCYAGCIRNEKYANYAEYDNRTMLDYTITADGKEFQADSWQVFTVSTVHGGNVDSIIGGHGGSAVQVGNQQVMFKLICYRGTVPAGPGVREIISENIVTNYSVSKR